MAWTDLVETMDDSCLAIFGISVTFLPQDGSGAQQTTGIIQTPAMAEDYVPGSVQGTAVVCADIPALREVSAGAARLVPAEDADAWAAALSDLLGDDAGLAKLVGAGWRRAAQFSWDATVRATREVYRQALA